jgi:hypothetical protein
LEKDLDSVRLNHWLSLGANFGVLIGIILLIVELGQARDMMRSQVRQQIAQDEANWLLTTAANHQLADVTMQAAMGEELNGADSLQYRSRLAAYFRLQENIHFQATQGLFDDVEFAGIKRQWRQFGALSPGVRREWCFLREIMSPRLQLDMTEVLNNSDCTALED